MTYRSCTVSRASAGLLSWSFRGCRAMKGGGPCASETRRTSNFNSTYTAKSWTWPASAAAAAPVSSLESWHFQTALTEHLEKVWNQPDEGIWEVRGPRRHFTHSKVMAWVALDRALKAVEGGHHEGPLDRWRKLRDEIHRDVCKHSFNPQRNAFVQYYGADTLDAASLIIPLVGFLPAHDARVVGTVEAIRRELTSDGLVMRYRSEANIDGLPAGEGVFLPCSFWLVDNLVMAGRYDEARQLFERLASLCNDVGLLSEEYDPVSRRLLGNFPQAFTHVSLVNSVHNLTLAEGPARHRSTG